MSALLLARCCHRIPASCLRSRAGTWPLRCLSTTESYLLCGYSYFARLLLRFLFDEPDHLIDLVVRLSIVQSHVAWRTVVDAKVQRAPIATCSLAVGLARYALRQVIVHACYAANGLQAGPRISSSGTLILISRYRVGLASNALAKFARPCIIVPTVFSPRRPYA